MVQLVDKLTEEKDCKILIYAKDKEKCLNLNYELKRQLDLEVLDFRKEEHRKMNFLLSYFKGIKINFVPEKNKKPSGAKIYKLGI